MTPELEAQVIDLYVQRGWSMKKVSRDLHVGYARVNAFLHERGLARAREDTPELGARIIAGMIGISLAEYKAHVAKGRKWCPSCKGGKGGFRPRSEFTNNRRRPDGLEQWCGPCKRRQDRAWDDAHRPCVERRKYCPVRWGRQQHRHCPEPVRLANGATVACDQPMVLDVDRCATCEALALLQARVAELEAVLRQRGIVTTRLPTLAQAS